MCASLSIGNERWATSGCVGNGGRRAARDDRLPAQQTVCRRRDATRQGHLTGGRMGAGLFVCGWSAEVAETATHGCGPRERAGHALDRRGRRGMTPSSDGTGPTSDAGEGVSWIRAGDPCWKIRAGEPFYRITWADHCEPLGAGGLVSVGGLLTVPLRRARRARRARRERVRPSLRQWRAVLPETSRILWHSRDSYRCGSGRLPELP